MVSFKASALPWLALICLLVVLVCYLAIAWSAVNSIWAAWNFRSYPQPYRATIVGFNKNHGRHTTTAPIVEVEIPGREKFRFSSSKFSSIQTFALREKVDLVTRPVTNWLGKPAEQLEIDNAYHLWIGDVLVALAIPAVLVGALAWPRFFPTRRRGQYILPDE